MQKLWPDPRLIRCQRPGLEDLSEPVERRDYVDPRPLRELERRVAPVHRRRIIRVDIGAERREWGPQARGHTTRASWPIAEIRDPYGADPAAFNRTHVGRAFNIG